MNRLPPSINSGLHPDDIIPFDMKKAFLDHYLCTFNTESTFDFDKALEKGNIKPEARKTIGAIYEELHLNGWFPLGVTKDENDRYAIKWAYRVSKPLPEISDMPKEMTPEQAREYFHKHVNDIGKSF